MWRHFELGRDRYAGLGGQLARVWVAVAPGPGERVGDLYGPALTDFLGEVPSATVCLPGGEAHAAMPGITFLRLAPLYGPGDRWLFPLVAALREGHAARHLRALPAARPLLVDDAARVAVGMAGRGGVHVVNGPELLTMDQVVARLCERFPGRCGPHLWRGLTAAERARLLPPVDHDDWDTASFGARIGVSEWIERLPGPRRKR